MIKQTKHFIVVNQAGDKILGSSNHTFRNIKKLLESSNKHWHLRGYFFDSIEDCEKAISWIKHYGQENSLINMTTRLRCQKDMKEGFVIKKATIVFNFHI